MALTAWCALALSAMALATPSKLTRPMNTEPYRIAVISDTHLLTPELADDGAAAQRVAQNDMKLVLHSDAIMQHIVEWAIRTKPTILLITGDLTFNGALASHERLASHLARLRQAGVPTLVIPGNHDVSCPNARAYLGGKSAQASTVTRTEFAQIYENFGYGATSVRDPHSLSYACEPIAGLVVLAIDSNRDEDNRLIARGDTANVYHNSGRVKPETLQWLHEQAELAHRRGKRVIAMMHHHLLEHVDGEQRFLPNYIVANHDEVTQTLVQHGVRVIFTGHLHITDAVSNDTITDVATGSASMYPMPLRLATLNPSLDTLSIETLFLEDLPSAMLAQGKSQVERSTPILAGVIANRLWSRIQGKLEQMMPLLQGVDASALPQSPQQAAALLMRHLQEPLTQSLLTVTRGGEDPQQAEAVIAAVKQGIQGMVDEIMPTQSQYMGPFLIENLWPRVEPMVRSALEDINQVGTPQQSSTPDHRLVIAL